jgi:hypothetical protein
MAKEKVKKPFYKKWWVWLLAVIIIGVATTGGEEETAEPASTEPKAEEKETASEEKAAETTTEETTEEVTLAGLNQPLKVGDVTFTVSGKSTATEVGGEFGQKAQGTYLIIDVAVKNEGKEAITTDSSFFKLVAGDVQYEADGVADVYVNESNSGFFLQQINPGLENIGKIVFDVPADVASNPELILNVQTGMFGTEQGQISLK